MLILHTMNGIVEPITDTDQLKRRQSIEGEKSLSFYLYKTERNDGVFDLVRNKEKIELEGDKYVIDICDREPIGDTIEKYVEARHEMFDRLKGEFQESVISGQRQLTQCLDLALANTGLTYEIIGAFQSQSFESFGQAKGLSLFQEAKKRFGFEYRVFGTHLIIANEISRYTDAQFRHGHNLKSISEHVDTTDLATYIKGFGAIDEDTGEYLATAEYESPHSYLYTYENGNKRLIHAEYVYDERFFNAEALLNEIISRLKDVPDYNLKITYEELKKNGLKLHNYDLGDYVWSIYEPMNLKIQPRIIFIEDYPFDPQISPVLELGVPRRDITKAVAGVQGAVNKIGTVEGSITQARAVAQEAQQAINNSSTTLSDHLNDFNRHITDLERTTWNAKETTTGAQTKANNAENNAKTYTDTRVGALQLLITDLQEQIDLLTARVEELEKDPVS